MKTNNHQKRKRFHSREFQWHTSKFTFTFHHKKKKHNLVQIICAMRSESNNMQAMQVHFDMDSKPVRVDNCATSSTSPYLKDFIDVVPVQVQKRVNGISGSLHDIRRGTIQWTFEDDEGMEHQITLPNSYHYVPGASSHILSPQHWSQTAKDNKPKPRGTWCATYYDKIVLWWNQMKYK